MRWSLVTPFSDCPVECLCVAPNLRKSPPQRCGNSDACVRNNELYALLIPTERRHLDEPAECRLRVDKYIIGELIDRPLECCKVRSLKVGEGSQHHIHDFVDGVLLLLGCPILGRRDPSVAAEARQLVLAGIQEIAPVCVAEEVMQCLDSGGTSVKSIPSARYLITCAQTDSIEF